MDYGLRTTDYGLRTTDYGLRTADCGLRTADCGLRTADCGLRTADCGLRTAGCGLRAAGCGLRAAGCGLRAAGCGLRAAGCGLRAAGCGLRAAGCGLRAAGCGLRAIKHRPSFDMPSLDQSRSQSFVPLDQRSGNESSGSIRFEITMENRILVIWFTAQSLGGWVRLHVGHFAVSSILNEIIPIPFSFSLFMIFVNGLPWCY